MSKKHAMYEKYAKLRDNAGVIDAKVSKETGISPSFFTDWRKGLYNPKLDKVIKLASYFGVSIEYFIG